jgi:hypothetical protein
VTSVHTIATCADRRVQCCVCGWSDFLIRFCSRFRLSCVSRNPHIIASRKNRIAITMSDAFSIIVVVFVSDDDMTTIGGRRVAAMTTTDGHRCDAVSLPRRSAAAPVIRRHRGRRSLGEGGNSGRTHARTRPSMTPPMHVKLLDAEHA